MRSEKAEVRRRAPDVTLDAMPEEETAPVAQARLDGEAGRAADVARVGFAPIVRVDAPSREVELCATSEAVDSHGTVFDYGASKDAFTRWAGNVREMHDRRAVGRRVQVRCDDETRKIFVRVRISRGAQDTWEKVLDGTLRGASIGASNVTWERQVRRVAASERPVNVATRYDLVELSLVDSPSNPDALGIAIVRDALPDVALLDDLGPEHTDEGTPSGEPYAPVVSPALTLPQRTRARRERSSHRERHRGEPSRQSGATLFGDTDLFGPVEARIARERAIRGWAELAEGAPETAAGAAIPGCMEMPRVREAMGQSATRRVETADVGGRLHSAARELMRGCRCPRCAGALAALGETEETRDIGGAQPLEAASVARALAAGLSASAERLEHVDGSVREMHTLLRAAVSQMAGTVGDLRSRLDALERQPVPGGPAARPVEKPGILAAGSGVQAAEQARALESLAGRISDPQAQIAVAAEIIRLRQAEM